MNGRVAQLCSPGRGSLAISHSAWPWQGKEEDVLSGLRWGELWEASGSRKPARGVSMGGCGLGFLYQIHALVEPESFWPYTRNLYKVRGKHIMKEIKWT